MSQATLYTDPGAEKAYIGSLLLLVNRGEFGVAHDATADLEPDCIHDPALRPIYAAPRRLLQRGEPFDHPLILSEVNGTVENAAGILLEAGESVATAVHIDGYAKVIRKAAQQRRAVCIVKDSLNELSKATDPTAAITKLGTKLDKITSANSTARPITAEAYKPFPLVKLPTVLGAYVDAASSAIGCDASFIALPILGCLARAIGNKRVIRLKRSWAEPAIVWAAIIGKSGTHKSPSLQAATSFLTRKQSEAITAFQEAEARYEQDFALYERDFQAWKRSKSIELPPWKPETPVCERYVTTDCTIEALASLLAAQFDGVLVCRDELAGWLGGIAEYKGGKGSDLGHWLASWSAAPLTVDRKSGPVKMLHIPRAAVSIVGGIQPGVLRTAIGQEHLQDGLCARLLFAMPDPKPVRWTDAIVDPVTEAAMGEVFDRLIGMTSGADCDGNPEPFAMPLSDGAKAVWIEFYNRHRAEFADLDDDLAAAWSKLEAYAARFALIFQLCSWAAGEQYASDQQIDEAAMVNGIALSDWFGGEAKRVYGLFGESSQDRGHRELVELIQRKNGRITARELQNSARQYRGGGGAEAALDDLQRAGYGRWQVVKTAGRPRREFVLHTVSTEAEANETAESKAFASVDRTRSAFEDFERERQSIVNFKLTDRAF